MTRRARCTLADIDRAMRAAEKAGGRRTIVIKPDGEIRILPPPEPVAEDEEVVL